MILYNYILNFQLEIIKSPIVSLLFVIQVFLGAYLAHLYANPTEDFLIPQSLMPFNVMRSIHTQLAILWVAVGWLVGGLLIAPWIANKDHKFLNHKFL